MKNVLLAVSLVGLVFLGSCSQNILSTPGAISFYSGESGGTIVSSSISTMAGGGGVSDVCLYIKKIEVSKTGEEWFDVISSSTEVRARANEVISFGASAVIPPGEYHGIRISFEPYVRILEVWEGNINTATSTDIVFEKLPKLLSVHGTNTNDVSSVENILLTTANQKLLAFDIEAGEETYILFDIYTGWYGDSREEIVDWALIVDEIYTTRFIN